MFEDETVGIACPSCGFKNQILVREFEQNSEMHVLCESCKVGLKIEAREFQHRLDEMRSELEELQSEARRDSRVSARRPRKDDFQI